MQTKLQEWRSTRNRSQSEQERKTARSGARQGFSIQPVRAGCSCGGSCPRCRSGAANAIGQDALKRNEEVVRQGTDQLPRSSSVTRNPSDVSTGSEVVTQNVTPAPAPGVTPPSPPPPSTPAPFVPAGQCFVTSGPSYTPSGTIPVTSAGGRKRASFSMAATFGTAYVTDPPRKASCCEVRQFIKWDEKFHKWNGGPPHSGFPSASTFGTWYEDRDSADKRYGHRSGPHSDPVAGCGDEYTTGGTQDQANGDTYCGRDSPGGPDTLTGTYNFQLKVVDVCNGEAVKATGPVITINW